MSTENSSFSIVKFDPAVHHEQALEALETAFAEDPFMLEMWKGDQRVVGKKTFLEAVLVVKKDETRVMIDDEDGTVVGVLCWQSREPGFLQEERTVARLSMRYCGVRGTWGTLRNYVSGVASLMSGLRRDYGKNRLYLKLVGIHSRYHGKGCGTQLLQQALEEVDNTTGASIYLESSNEKNLRFYQRHGFELHEKRLWHGAALYPMVRPGKTEK